MARKSQMVEAFGWAARDASGVLSPFKFLRRATGERDVQFKVLYCGICDWDMIVLKDGFGTTTYPVVPGHEIVGVVTEVGSKVQKFKVGDTVGVGTLVGSCRTCKKCKNDLENYCHSYLMADGACYTYGNTVCGDMSTRAYGGYSDIMVVDEYFAIVWPAKNYPLAAGVPLLCGGIVAYSPMRYYGLDEPGMHIGIVGLGGIGRMAVKFAKAFGAKVTVISTSINKKQEALEKFGADSFLFSKDTEEMEAAADTLDGIIDTAPKIHPIAPLIDLLKFEGKLILLGAVEESYELPASPLIVERKMVAGSASGSVKEIQEMMDFAAKHNIVAEIEIIPIDYVNIAIGRIEKGDATDRFVIDIANTLKSGEDVNSS
uniref:18-hydroxynorfluorocurarine reductase n=1 Tax=Strychnos nux-vomica TaxID=28545 RepID=WS_STRNX|nr:Wieland-Gumlich aldehyde synthase [Strychnos nux-vomica]